MDIDNEKGKDTAAVKMKEKGKKEGLSEYENEIDEKEKEIAAKNKI